MGIVSLGGFAGSKVLLSETTFGSAAASHTFSSIDQGFEHLQIEPLPTGP